jgi:exosortase/archaeosortase family protein
MWSFLTKLIVLIMVLLFIDVSTWGQRNIVDPFTAGVAKVSVTLMQAFDDDVESVGRQIYTVQPWNGKQKVNEDGSLAFNADGTPYIPPWVIEIAPGCNGLEAVAILIAALIAFPATWKQRGIGFLVGFLAIQILNQVRIISLFYIGMWDMRWFEWFHLYLWQALIILDALVVWLLWLRWITRDNQRRRPPPPKAGPPQPQPA